MYYFWSVRALNVGYGVGLQPPEYLSSPGEYAFHHYLEGIAEMDASSLEWEWDEEVKGHNGQGQSEGRHQKKMDNPEIKDIRVGPAQGMLKQREAVDFTIKASCPSLAGYYACVIR